MLLFYGCYLVDFDDFGYIDELGKCSIFHVFGTKLVMYDVTIPMLLIYEVFGTPYSLVI